ncbi:copper-binding protein [Terrihabitans soli]|uniref:Copper-binding protein n=1 Tax=Terrihabitans soli TaxID=708113 RepID=A0A6S6QWE1_9HYPH|nr:SCO family protein [Terrihabitans soli]BCJ91895.1 copper-binding protein [Terrihabitans soli]
MAKKLRPSLIAGPILFLVGLIGLGVGFFVFKPPQTQVSTATLVGGPFKLIDQNGAAVTDVSMKGKPFLVFFGFTHCPDICPTKLFEMSQALNVAEKSVPDIEALFISVDPERDTPDVMKRYLSSFSPRIKGLTGDQASVDAAVKAYRAYAKKVPTDSGYTMDHTSLVYLMGRNGEFLTSLDMTKKDTEIAEQISSKL